MCFYESPFDTVHQRGDSVALAVISGIVHIPDTSLLVLSLSHLSALSLAVLVVLSHFIILSLVVFLLFLFHVYLFYSFHNGDTVMLSRPEHYQCQGRP